MLVFWIALTITAIGLANRYGGPASTEFGSASSQSSQALALFRQHFPQQAADTLTLAVHSTYAPLDDPAVKARVLRAVDRLATSEHVTGVRDPYQAPYQVSPDRHTGYAVGTLAVSSEKMPAATVSRLLNDLKALDGGDVTFSLGGAAVDAA